MKLSIEQRKPAAMPPGSGSKPRTARLPPPAVRTPSREPGSLPLCCRAGIDRGPAHAMIGKPHRGHPREIENVAAIEDDRLAQQPDHDLEIGVAEFIPFGGDHQR